MKFFLYEIHYNTIFTMSTDISTHKFEEIQKFLRSHIYEKDGRVDGKIDKYNLSLMFKLKNSKEYEIGYTCYLDVVYEEPYFKIIFPGKPSEYYNFKCHNGDKLTDRNIHVRFSIDEEDRELHEKGDSDLNDIVRAVKKKFMVK